ncbi:unnamed protein product, partial [Choristocarpus tenellus]
LQSLFQCARSNDLDFEEAVKRTLAGETPGQRPPPLRAAAERDRAGSRAEAKDESTIPTGGGQGEEGSDKGGGDKKGSAKQEMEEMGAAAKAMGVPQSRRLSSRGGLRAESKTSNAQPTGGMGDEPGGAGGRDLTEQIEACTGETSRTREMLEPIISRPKLAEKLLNMPPFRFLHDIVSEITRQTGFAEGLYTAEELNSANVKAKPAKVQS